MSDLRNDPLLRQPLRARLLLPTPAGPMTALATANGLAGLVFGSDRHHRGPYDAVPDLDSRTPPGAARALHAAAGWLQAYWRGDQPDPAQVPLDLHGTPWQQSVWRALLLIPHGQTRSYGEVAASLSSPGVARATGQAIGRNPVAVLIPCHRVLGRSGALTGYAGGLPLKVRLLRHEGVLLT